MKRLIKPLPWQAAFFLLPFSFLLITACPDPPKDNTPERDTTIHLEVLSTFTTTAKLYISVDDTTAEWTFGLTRNGEDVLTATVYNNDTTFTDGGLNPGTQYTYQAQWLDDGIAVDSSLNVVTQTMDTTSHNFVWEIDTLGEYGSYLNDVAIIDENNIWVVGNIETVSGEYNAAKWDGSEWELMVIYSNTLDLYSIQYFNEDDIWVTDYCSPIHWDGNVWTLYHLQNLGLDACAGNAIRGTSSSNIYFVGNGGSIVHYDGSEFTKMESGTEVDLEDIDGTEDGEHLIVSGFDLFGYNNTSPLLHIHNGEITKVYESTYPWGNEEDWGRIEAIEVIGDTVYLSTWGRDWIAYNYLTGEAREYLYNSIPEFYGMRMVDVCSNGINDILLAGAFPATLHFNGVSWMRDNQVFDLFGENNFIVEKSDMNNNVVVMVGRFYGNAGGVIARGYRIQ
ncbi:MAG: hypothetical protein H8E08_00110 [Candidatus Marinimicrobia bacterium]|nr:hypothetical protein [Candidatus Neomarinimicrobiota bacterium]